MRLTQNKLRSRKKIRNKIFFIVWNSLIVNNKRYYQFANVL